MQLLQQVYVHYILRYFKDLFAWQWSNSSMAQAIPSQSELSHGNTKYHSLKEVALLLWDICIQLSTI